MAAAYPEYDSTDLFECQVCLHYMLDRQPRTLQCNHTFCHACLEKLIKTDRKADLHVVEKRIRCPTCRKKTILPSGSLSKLPINFDLPKMNDHLRLQDTLRKMEMLKPLCEMFSRHKSRPTATKICIECVRKLCDDCAEHHDKMTITKDHTVIGLKLKESQECMTKTCVIHKQSTKYICTDCCQTLCFECTFDEKHSFHLEKIANFQDGMQTFRGETNTLQDKCETFGKHATFCRGKIIEEIEKLNSVHTELTNLRTKIERKVDSVNEMLKQVGNQMEVLQCVVSDFSSSEQKLHSLSEILETLSTLEDDNYLSEFKKCQFDVCSALQEYEMGRRHEFRSYQFEKGTVDLTGTIANLRDITIAVPAFPVLNFVLNGQGNIKFTSPEQILAVDQDSAILVDREKAIYYLDNKGFMIKSYMFDVFSIAICNNQMFVTKTQLQQYIYTTSLENWKLEPKCKLAGEPLYMLVKQHEIISSLHKKNLISTFNFKGKKKNKFVANVQDAGRLSRIVAHYKEYIVITKMGPVGTEKETKGCENKETSDEAHDNDEEHDVGLINVHQKESDTENGIYADDVSLESDDADDYDGDTIFVFSSDGTLVSSFGEKGNQDGQLLYPEATTATPSGNILVADYGNHRICQFSINGMFLGHVLTEKDGIKWPTAFDYKTPKLWLTESDGEDHCKAKLFDILID